MRSRYQPRRCRTGARGRRPRWRRPGVTSVGSCIFECAPGVGERRRADLHRGRAGEQQLGGVPAAGDAADADDRQVGQGGVDVVHGAHGDRVDRPARTARRRRRRGPAARRRGRSARPSSVLMQRHGLGAGLGARRAAMSTMRSVLALSFAQRGRPHAGRGGDHRRRQLGVVGEDRAASLEVRARQVDLDGDDRGGRGGQQCRPPGA